MFGAPIGKLLKFDILAYAFSSFLHLGVTTGNHPPTQQVSNKCEIL